jgi:hypothetical protein
MVEEGTDDILDVGGGFDVFSIVVVGVDDRLGKALDVGGDETDDLQPDKAIRIITSSKKNIVFFLCLIIFEIAGDYFIAV